MRRLTPLRFLGPALVAVLGTGWGLPTRGGAQTAAADGGAAERILADVRWLADDAREGRAPGTRGLREAGEWIEARLSRIGVEPGAEEGFRQPFPVRAGSGAAPVEAFNVVGRIPAGAADRLTGAVVVGAHYDHLGMGGPSSLAPGAREVHNGADDNASGVAALLEIARRLNDDRAALRRDVWLVAFSAEELGNIGSSVFVHAPPPGLRLEEVVAMLNLDMVGRLRNDALSLLGGDTAEEWDDLARPRCAALQLTCSVGGDGFGASDHASFYAAGIPVLHFFTGVHEEYHTPADDVERIDPAGAAQVAALAAALASDLAGRETPLTFRRSVAAPSRRGMARGARLGTVPDYAGPPVGREGVLLAAVRAGSPAERAGLRRGDVIVSLGGHTIASVEDFMGVLQAARPGERAVVVVEREGRRVEMEVEYGSPGGTEPR